MNKNNTSVPTVRQLNEWRDFLHLEHSTLSGHSRITFVESEINSIKQEIERWKKKFPEFLNNIDFDLAKNGRKSAGGEYLYMRTSILSMINSLKAKLKAVNQDEEILQNTDNFFVRPGRIEELKKFNNNSSFDLSRVIRFCEEINSNFKNKNYYSIIFLIRAMIDHLPPIFEKANFSVFVSQLNRSTKGLLSPLEEKARSIADRAIHTQIGKREPLMSEAQIGFQKEFDVLLEEVLKVPSKTGSK